MVFDFGVSRSGLLKLLGLTSNAAGLSDAQVFTQKDFDVALNNLIQTTPSLGAILVDNGTKVVARARPAAHLPLHGKADGSDIEYSKLEVAGGGTGQVTLPTGTVLIGAGTSGITTKANPAGAFLDDSSAQNVTGLKTFSTTTFAARNPAGTQTLTYANPAIVGALTKTLPIIMSPYRFTVERIGTHYYAMKNDGSIFSSDTTGHPETVIQACIDQCETDGGGDVYIVGDGNINTITLSSTFAGFTIGNATGGSTPDVKSVNVICDVGVKFKINTAFTGVFCTFTNATQRCGWYGGNLYMSVPDNDWIGFELISTSQAGNTFHTIERVIIEDADIGIKLTSNGAQAYVNGNYFHDVVINKCNMGVLFNQVDAYVSGQNSMNRNYFNNVIVEHSNRAAALYGFKDVIGRDNFFLHCKVWDILQTGSYHTCTITANAENTTILGGIMRQVGWPADNLSSTTVAYDMWGGGAYYMGVPRMNDNYEDVKTMSAPGDGGTGYIRKYPKATDANNDALYAKAKLAGTVTEMRYWP